MEFINEMENLVEDLDAFLSKRGAPAGHQTRRYEGQPLVEIVALGRWPSSAKHGKFMSEMFDAMDWAYVGEDKFQNERLHGDILHSTAKVGKDAFGQAKAQAETDQGNVFFKLSGHVSKDGRFFAAKSVTFVDMESHPMLRKRELELCGPTSFASGRFGELKYDAARSVYTGQAKHEGKMTSLTFRCAPDAIDGQSKKMELFFDELGSIQQHADIQEHALGGDLLLGSVTLDGAMFTANFRVPQNHDVAFVHVTTFCEDQAFARTEVEVERHEHE